MRRSFAIVAAAAFTGVASAGKGFTGKPVIAGYWPSYASQLLEPKDVPYKEFTHIDWFVAETKPTYDLALSGSEKEMKEIIAGAHKKGVTVSLVIGGWTGSIYFSDLVANATGRAAYAKSIKGYLDKYKFDGVDLDWEFPAVQGIGCNTIRPEDTENFLEFLKVLRETVGPDSRLSAAVSVTGLRGPDGALYPKAGEFGKYFDYLTIMAYDIYGSWSQSTGPLGPLFDTCATEENVGVSGAAAVKIWKDAGFPVNKLLLGVPSYAHAYLTEDSVLTPRTVGNTTTFLYQNKTAEVPVGGVTSGPAGPDVCGVENGASSNWLFTELISTGKLTADGKQAKGDWTRYWDDCSQTPFLFNNVTREFIPYDDAQSYTAKAEFVRKHGLAGINMFDLTGDTKDSKLIEAARKQLIGTFGDVGSLSNVDPTGSGSGSGAAGGAAPKNPDNFVSRRAQPPQIFAFLHRMIHGARRQRRSQSLL